MTAPNNNIEGAARPSLKNLTYVVIASVAISAAAAFGLLNDNAGEATIGDIRRILIATTLFGVLGPTLFFIAGAKLRAAAWAFPIFAFSFFQCHVFIQATYDLSGSLMAAGIFGYLGPFFIWLLASLIIARVKDLSVLGFFALAGGAMALVSGAQAFLQGETPSEKARINTALASYTAPISLNVEAENAPDIIYIVPDRYGAEETLNQVYGANLGAFHQALETRGFYRAPNARANYARTFQSLASTMNLNMLDDIADELGAESNNSTPIYRALQNNVVQRSLRAAGYEFIYVGNWWSPARHNPYADINYYGARDFKSSLTEIESTFLRVTPMQFFLPIFIKSTVTECDRLKNQLAYLKKVRAQSDRPVFVFAHLTMPHDPITMDRQGRCIPEIRYDSFPFTRSSTWPVFRDAFRDYLGHLNDQLIEIFDAAKAADTPRPFIFAIQSDEGPFPKRLRENMDMEMHDLKSHEVRDKFGILNTIFWDEDLYGPPMLSDTPLNNWRIIFSRIFDADMPMIEDERSLMLRSMSRLYDLRDVTQTLKDDDSEPHPTRDRIGDLSLVEPKE